MLVLVIIPIKCRNENSQLTQTDPVWVTPLFCLLYTLLYHSGLVEMNNVCFYFIGFELWIRNPDFGPRHVEFEELRSKTGKCKKNIKKRKEKIVCD